MANAPIYDRIGRGYAQRRQPDRRIAARVAGALGDARTVVNVGAGAGSYEPQDRQVIAVEPSPVRSLSARRARRRCFSILDAEVTERALTRLATDLESGEWQRRNAELLDLDELDLGYRLVIAGT
jgi:hypothetical protein